MAKTKAQRESVFGEEEEGTARIPHIPVSAINQIYETGFAGLPTAAFEDPVEKENQQLKGHVADLMEQLQSRTSDLLVQDGTLIVHDFQLTPTGLIAPEEVSFEAWEQLGMLLFKLEGSIQWLIGDWLAYGEDLRYGDIDKIATALGRKAKTLYNYASYSRSIKTSLRREDLSYNHHVLVAALDARQQSTSLAYAAEHGLSVAAFREWLNEQQGALPAQTSRPALGEEWHQYQPFFSDPYSVSSLSKEERQRMIQRVKKMVKWWESLDKE